MGVTPDLDMSEFVASKSKHATVEDLVGPPRILQIKEARPSGDKDRPVVIIFHGLDLPYLPAKTVRRILNRIWPRASRSAAKSYPGRWLRLFVDPEVTWGQKGGGVEKVGGIRINGASHIKKTVSGTTVSGMNKRARFSVDPIQPPQNDEEQFRADVKAAGMVCDVVDKVCAAKRWPPPMKMSTDRRGGMLEWLQTEEGRAAYLDAYPAAGEG